MAPILIAAFVVASCAHRVASTEPHVWQLRGVVASAESTTVTVRHKSGQLVQLSVDGETVYLRNGQTASRVVVVPGTRVMVDVETQSGRSRARQIRVFSQAPSTALH